MGCARPTIFATWAFQKKYATPDVYQHLKIRNVLKYHFKMQQTPEKVKISGINLTKYVHDLYDENFKTLMRKIQGAPN